MEDEIDQIINENLQEERNRDKYKYISFNYWKEIFWAIFSFFYLFFYTIIYPPKNENRSQIDNRENRENNNRNNFDRRSLMNQRRPNHFRYRSRGGG